MLLPHLLLVRKEVVFEVVVVPVVQVFNVATYKRACGTNMTLPIQAKGDEMDHITGSRSQL